MNDSKAFIKYSNNMDDICRNTEEYKPNRKAKILIAFDDVITDMISNKKLDPIGTGSLNVSLIFITQFYFVVPIGPTHLFYLRTILL